MTRLEFLENLWHCRRNCHLERDNVLDSAKGFGYLENYLK